MSRTIFKIIGIFSLVLFSVSVFAQNGGTRKKKKRSAYEPATTNVQGQDTATSKPTGGGPKSAYGSPVSSTPSSGDSTKLRIVEVKGTTGNGLLDVVKPSLRNDAAIELNLIKERTPLEYENIREDDAVYRVRVWREIDTREKINLPFRYAAEEDNGSQRFVSILLGAIKRGDVTAFSSDDDRFTTPITADDAMNAFGGGYTMSKVIDSLGNVDHIEKRLRPVDPDSIYKFRLKEEWIFDKQTSRLYVRILGIAPMAKRLNSLGTVIEGSEHPVWWVYYPDIRPTLAKYDVYNPKNIGAHTTWEDLFEARMFSSYIIKSSLDNAFDKTLADKYPNSTLFRLLEGEKIKEKIFDYEQSLWSY